MITFQEYQRRAAATAVYPHVGLNPDSAETIAGCDYIYPTLGLCGEAGEVAEKVKKLIRDKNGAVNDESRMAIAKELGDVLWYVGALCTEIGVELDEVASINIDKLFSRKERGVIGGSGDER